MVYTSFEPSAMRTTEHSARGLRDLKAFLEYAKQGAAVLDCQPGSASKEKETINRQIAEKLREKGWKADINIGTGKFRIDVAVHHPEKTDEYCLGIMFDDDASCTSGYCAGQKSSAEECSAENGMEHSEFVAAGLV